MQVAQAARREHSRFGFDFELHLHTSAGRYICGEETALISSLEGKRAVPRAKPPFPATAGLFGKPTVVNNIETLCNVPHIIHYGSDWYAKLSEVQDGGTKLERRFRQGSPAGHLGTADGYDGS